MVSFVCHVVKFVIALTALMPPQQSHEDKAVMRPLYTRYRSLKQLLVREDSKVSFTIHCKFVPICQILILFHHDLMLWLYVPSQAHSTVEGMLSINLVPKCIVFSCVMDCLKCFLILVHSKYPLLSNKCSLSKKYVCRRRKF